MSVDVPRARTAVRHPQVSEPELTFGPYEAFSEPGSTGGTLVVFNSLGNPPQRMASWEFRGQIASAAPGWQVISVRDQSRSWFNKDPASLAALAEWLSERIKEGPGPRLVTLGSSVGGFGAILFARALGADTCITLSPQTVVARALTAGSDPRWNGFIPPDEDLVHGAVAAAPGCVHHVVYPAFDLLDVWQASLLKPERGFFYARLTEEHNCAAELKAESRLAPFLSSCILSPDEPAELTSSLPARFDFGGRTVKAFLRQLKEIADDGVNFDQWCLSAGVDEPFDSLFLPYWCHARGDSLRDEDVAALSDGQLLSLLKRFPSRLVALMVDRRRHEGARRPSHAKGWLTTWRAWQPHDRSLSRILQSGWSRVENWGVWSVGIVSEITLPVALVPATEYRLRLSVRPPPSSDRATLLIVVRLGAETCATKEFTVVDRGELVVVFTAPATAAPTVGITASVERTTCALLDHPVYADTRACGFGLEAVSIGVL